MCVLAPCVCVCVCACVRACVRACVCALCVHVFKQPGSMTKGYKPPTVVFKLTDRYPECGYYHPAGRLGNGTTETGRDAHAQVLVTKVNMVNF